MALCESILESGCHSVTRTTGKGKNFCDSGARTRNGKRRDRAVRKVAHMVTVEATHARVPQQSNNKASGRQNRAPTPGSSQPPAREKLRSLPLSNVCGRMSAGEVPLGGKYSPLFNRCRCTWTAIPVSGWFLLHAKRRPAQWLNSGRRQKHPKPSPLGSIFQARFQPKGHHSWARLKVMPEQPTHSRPLQHKDLWSSRPEISSHAAACCCGPDSLQPRVGPPVCQEMGKFEVEVVALALAFGPVPRYCGFRGPRLKCVLNSKRPLQLVAVVAEGRPCQKSGGRHRSPHWDAS